MDPVHSYQSFSPSGHPQDSSAGILYRLALKVNNVWQSTKTYFTHKSTSAINEALQNARPIAPNSSSDSTEPSLSETEGPVLAFEEGDTDNDEPVAATTETASETSRPVAPTNQAEINGVLMEFTVTINGKTIPLDQAMIKELLPLFERLAQDKKETLTTGFTCAIDLNDPKNVHIFQNGTELFKKSCPKLLREASLRNNIEQFIKIVKLYEKGDLNIEPEETEDTEETNTPQERQPRWIEDVDGDGDCLLLAALMHISGRKFKGPAAQRAADDLRVQIATKAQQEEDVDAQIAIIEDIKEAREFVRVKEQTEGTNLSATHPYNHLFTEEMNGLFDLDIVHWQPSIGVAYSNYLLDPLEKAYLGAYAIHFLNTTEASRLKKYCIVQKGPDGTYIPVDGFGDFSRNSPIEKMAILLRDGNHYQYVDSEDTDFQAALRRGLENNRRV